MGDSRSMLCPGTGMLTICKGPRDSGGRPSQPRRGGASITSQVPAPEVERLPTVRAAQHVTGKPVLLFWIGMDESAVLWPANTPRSRWNEPLPLPPHCAAGLEDPQRPWVQMQAQGLRVIAGQPEDRF